MFRDCFYENKEVSPEDLKKEEILKEYVKTRMNGVTYAGCQRGRATTRFILDVEASKVDVYLNSKTERRFNNIMEVRRGKSCTIAQDGKSLILDVPNASEETLRFSYNVDHLDNISCSLIDPVVCLGEYVSGEPVYVSLDNSSMLVAGMMGSGKSVCLHNIVLSLLYHYGTKDMQLYMIDPKKVTFRKYENIAGVHPVAYNRKDAMLLLEDVCKEMDRRYEKFASVNREKLSDYNGVVAEADRLPHITLLIDEADSFFAIEDSVEKEMVLRLRALVAKIAKEGRACGVHLIVASQKPSGKNLDLSIRSQLGIRVALRLESSNDSRMVIMQKGAEHLRGDGDSYILVNDRLDRFQVSYMEPEEIDKAIEWLKENR